MSRMRLGLVCGGVLGLISLTIVGILNLHLGDHSYSAEFARADGARVGNDVRIAGIKVGTVTGSSLDGDHIDVTFRIDGDLKLGARTTAEMKVMTLLGAYYLELAPAGTGDLPDDTIPLAQTRSPYTLESVISEGGKTLQELDAGALRDAMAAMTGALGGDGDRLGEVLDGVTSLTGIAAKREEQLTALIKAAREATSVVKVNRQELFSLIEGSDLLLRELLQRREVIGVLLTKASGLATTLRQVMAENVEPVNDALTGLRTVVGILTRSSASIDRTLESMAPTMRYLANAVGSGPYLSVNVTSLWPDNALCATGAVQGCS
ncbi:MAG TPA: MCE family protein [Nocardioidaceae bacterium]|nr:MCE family protein [Nocardioidaceae bacterium]